MDNEKKRVLKICCGTWENASRDKRELSVCRGLGAEVIVMAKGNPGDNGRKDIVDGYDVYRFSTRPLGRRIPNAVNRALSIFIWGRKVRYFKPDVISGHDLSGLIVGWLSTWFVPKRRKPKLVYDAHEFEIGRNNERGRIAKCLIGKMERFLIKRCAFSIMVNDSIADEVQRIHKLKRRPLVVRSTPENWKLDSKKISQTREEICREMGVSKDTFLLMYHGGLMPKRNIEALLGAVARNPNVAGVVLGNGTEAYLNELKNKTRELGIESRIVFHPSVPLNELYRYAGAADAGMILHQKYAANAEYSLPNKFFENVQSLTPIISTDTLVLKGYIERYGIGIAVDITNAQEIDRAIERLRTDKAFYASCKVNLSVAKEELCWDRERVLLQEEYANVLC
ncbi:MAG: glycosyltransferase [Clostridia bacterium]|nr:glycosyltransferase [Clostridia bacterium]